MRVSVGLRVLRLYETPIKTPLESKATFFYFKQCLFGKPTCFSRRLTFAHEIKRAYCWSKARWMCFRKNLPSIIFARPKQTLEIHATKKSSKPGLKFKVFSCHNLFLIKKGFRFNRAVLYSNTGKMVFKTKITKNNEQRFKFVMFKRCAYDGKVKRKV